MLRRLAILSFSSAIALLATVAQAETLNVILLLSDSAPPYRQFSAALGKTLAESGVDVAVSEAQADGQLRDGGSAKTDLAVAVGAKATEFAFAGSGAPLLSIMVPKVGYEALLERHFRKTSAREVSAIYLDQPWDRQLDFIRAALPRHSVVGVLYSADMPIALPRLPRGMAFNVKSVRSTETLFDALEHILGSSDVLLVVPDSEIYSSSNVRNILLTSYRHKVPLIGISQAYVNAGALGAVFSTPEQLAAQAGEAIVSFAKSRRLPEPQHPALFTIALNLQVARSLGIALDTPEAIRERMDRAGEAR
jgi:hypothetical protein